MNILEYLENKGFKLNRCTANEFSCECPFCGGKDRFRIWPEDGNGGRWACRQGLGVNHPGRPSATFSAVGDIFDLVKALDGLNYNEARQLLNLPSNTNWSNYVSRPKAKNSFKLYEEKPKNEKWVASAMKLILSSSKTLLSNSQNQSKVWGVSQSLDLLTYLTKERCLTVETVKRFKLGMISDFQSQSVEEWGLEPWQNTKNGELCHTLSFFRNNLLIPTWRRGGYIDRIKIRFPKPSTSGQRFTTVRGGNDAPAPYNKQSNIYVVVESELDAILLAQECPAVCPVALGGVGKYPNSELDEELKKAKLILLFFDQDREAEGALGKWQSHYSNSRPARLPKEWGKDPTDLELNYRNGKAPVSLSDFINCAIEITEDDLKN